MFSSITLIKIGMIFFHPNYYFLNNEENVQAMKMKMKGLHGLN
jgi:hypothetical protein